jgi:ABC-type antimicrobial peptide transport system permease subunit
VLAVIGFWIAVISELRDERGELFDLEAQGVAPATLRRQLRLRSAGVVALGIIGGFALGLALSRLVVAVVKVSGTTAPPDPPLRVDAAWPLVGAGIGGVIVALAIVVELTTRRAFRGETPERASWSLE